MTQQGFRRHKNQGLSEIPPYLPPQDVEVIRRGCAIGDLHIVFGAHLQITFKARGGMFRPLPFVAMWQQKRQPRHAQPFRFGRGNKLIDENLRGVREIPELTFPANQRAGFGQRKTIIKPHDGGFRKGAVMHFVGRVVGTQGVQRDIALFGVLIVQNGMAL